MTLPRILPYFALLFSPLVLLAQAPALPAPPAVAVPAKKPAKSEWVFSILPKSFQKNPNVELTVITEMTELGKKQPVASPASPVYYVAQSSGFHQMGQIPGSERTLKPEDVERLLTHALVTNGFLPAEPPAHPPTIVIFYTWGSHNRLVEDDPDNPSLSGDQVMRNLLDRAALVGGVKFSQDMLKLFNEADDMATLNPPPRPDPTGSAGPPVLGPEQLAFLNPINRYKQADPKNEFLFEQFTNDVYYVVATAYDPASIATKTKRLYWRTRMTVAAQGVSQDQTLPTLIATSAPFLGREMTEPETLTKRAVPDGQVKIGEAIVVDAPPKARPAAPPKTPTKP